MFPDRDERKWSSKVAREYGCVVTFENEAGTTLVAHRGGVASEGLRDAIDAALAADPTFRVVAYSTPATILADLDGARMDTDGASGHRRDYATPEAMACSLVGRPDAVHPRLLRPGGDGSRRSRSNSRKPKPPRASAATVAAAEQRRAQTHCVHGHEWGGDNLYVNPVTGKRRCRTCQNKWNREHRERRTAADEGEG